MRRERPVGGDGLAAPEGEGGRTVHRLRRYANRKLYDVSLGRFTNQGELIGLLRSGVDVQVTDHQSGRDITEEVLAQVIRSSVAARDGQPGVSLLSQLIRSPVELGRALLEQDTQQAELRRLRSDVEELTRMLESLLAEGEEGK